PRRDVLDADAHVRAQAGFRDRAAGDPHVEELLRRDVHLWPLAVELVLLLSERAVELAHRGVHEIGMGDPRPIKAVGRLTFLIVANLRECGLGDRRVAAIGNERGHATERKSSALVARLYKELRVRAHEWHSHRDLPAIGQDEFFSVAELLDD